VLDIHPKRLFCKAQQRERAVKEDNSVCAARERPASQRDD
jgi:hypothetical protein